MSNYPVIASEAVENGAAEVADVGAGNEPGRKNGRIDWATVAPVAALVLPVVAIFVSLLILQGQTNSRMETARKEVLGAVETSETDLTGEIHSLRDNLTAQVESLRDDMRQDNLVLGSKIDTERRALLSRMDALDAAMTEEIRALREALTAES